MESVKYLAYFILIVASVIIAYSLKESGCISLFDRIIKFSTILLLGLSIIFLIWFLKSWWTIHVAFDFYLGQSARELYKGNWGKLKNEEYEKCFNLATKKISVNPTHILRFTFIFFVLSILSLMLYLFLQIF
ncbi:MAG: hypothetical protein ACTSRL_22720 [Candidatus Helarchaeota archaeon]